MSRPDKDPRRHRLQIVHDRGDHAQRERRENVAFGENIGGRIVQARRGRVDSVGTDEKIRDRSSLRVWRLRGRAVLGPFPGRHAAVGLGLRLRGVRGILGRSSRNGRPFQIGATRRESSRPPRPLGSLQFEFPRLRGEGHTALFPGLRALRGARPTTRLRIQRQIGRDRRHPPRFRDRGNCLWRARDQRPAFLLPAPPPGPRRALRVHRFCQAAERRLGRRRSHAPRRTHVQLLRSTRRPRQRTHRRQHTQTLLREQALPLLAHLGPGFAQSPRQAPRPLRASRRRSRLRLGHQLLRPVGRPARQGPRQAGRHRHQVPRRTLRRPIQPLHKRPAPRLPRQQVRFLFPPPHTHTAISSALFSTHGAPPARVPNTYHAHCFSP
mmetsp:Transcript_12242/g.38949  ORF Transcript_12242/g.38949 Transcript_12242/m.38949 type:complete len:381 (+) Transcript_12242:568-1710(+)